MSRIEWTDKTWNPVTGCTPVSEGCQHCYAERMARRLAGRCGYPEAPNHFDVTLHYDRLSNPCKWVKPCMVFVCSMGDLFHPQVPDHFIANALLEMAFIPRHTYQILTKRPKRMRAFLSRCASPDGRWVTHNGEPILGRGGNGLIVSRADCWPLTNVWLGVTAENQQTADERIPVLLDTPAAIRFVSVEPMLERITINHFLNLSEPIGTPAEKIVGADMFGFQSKKCLDQVICGAETGPGARPMKLSWARDLRDQCQSAGVPFFMKKVTGGKQPPDGLMIRQYPNPRGLSNA